MQINERIKNAVVRGINEAFDMADMVNAMPTDRTNKKAVEKHSKVYMHLKSLIDRKCDIRKLTRESEDIPMFIEVYDGDQTDETKELKTMFEPYEDYIRLVMMIYKAIEGEDFTDADYRMLTKLSKIKTNRHPLYACYKVDNEELRTIINAIITQNYFDHYANLNWLDVSGVTNLDELFDIYYYAEDSDTDFEYDLIYDDESREINYFDGDISLWDVSNVTSMARTFMCCSFNGDLSKWNVGNV